MCGKVIRLIESASLMSLYSLSSGLAAASLSMSCSIIHFIRRPVQCRTFLMPSSWLFMTLQRSFIAFSASASLFKSSVIRVVTSSSSTVVIFFYVSLVKLIYFKNVSFWHVDWKCKKYKQTRRQNGHMNTIVESVVRWMNGSNCEADWAWDIVRYI